MAQSFASREDRDAVRLSRQESNPPSLQFSSESSKKQLLKFMVSICASRCEFPGFSIPGFTSGLVLIPIRVQTRKIVGLGIS